MKPTFLSVMAFVAAIVLIGTVALLVAAYGVTP
jgi:hypothetical protein